MSNPLFCLMGPTASGKTALALELVGRFPIEIISVDSAMIYRGMDIGTAKPDAPTLLQAPHHLIDIIDPPESYSAALFCKDVMRLNEGIIKRGKIPLLVGGTMMYFHALQQGLSALPEADEAIRTRLLKEAEEKGAAYMHQWLASVDPKTAARVHQNDAQRIQRALEVYEVTNKPLSFFIDEQKAVSSHPFINFSLMPEDRSWLHKRIALRFEEMLKAGFVEEVRALQHQWHLTLAHPSMRSVGYRQVLLYLQGEYGYEDLSTKGIAATRQLAKRQLTWLRHWDGIHHFPAENPQSSAKIVAIMQQILDNPKFDN
jgi:tRNA dimethylallyltransferase